MVLASLFLAPAARAANRYGYLPIQSPPALVIFETATRSRVATVELSGPPTDVAVPSVGQAVYVASNCQVVAINVATHRITATIAPPDDSCCAQRLATDAAGTLVVATDSYEDGCGVWMIDPAQSGIVGQSDLSQLARSGVLGVSGLAVSPDGRTARSPTSANPRPSA